MEQSESAQVADLRESLDRAQRDRDAYYSAMERAVRELESSGGATANGVSRDLLVSMDRNGLGWDEVGILGGCPYCKVARAQPCSPECPTGPGIFIAQDKLSGGYTKRGLRVSSIGVIPDTTIQEKGA